MRIIYIDINGKEIITTLTADMLPFHTHDYEPKNENIQAHILNSAIHVTPEQTANFHGHSNKTDLDNYNPANFAKATHTHQWEKINFTVNTSAVNDGIPEAQVTATGTLRKYIGTYLAQKTEIIKNLNDLTEKSYNSLTDKPNLSSLHSHSNRTVLDLIVDNGDGSQFLANDGTYKSIQGGSGAYPAGACYVYSGFNDVAPYYSSIDNAVIAGYKNIQLGAGSHTLSEDINDVHIQGLSGSQLVFKSVSIENCIIEVPIVLGRDGFFPSFSGGITHIKCLEIREMNIIASAELNIDTIIHSSNSYYIEAGIVNIHGSNASSQYQTTSNPDKTHFALGKGSRLYIANLRFAEYYVEPRDIDGVAKNCIIDVGLACRIYLKNCRICGQPDNAIIMSNQGGITNTQLLLDNCVLIGNGSVELKTTNNTVEQYWNRNTIAKVGVSGWQAINGSITVDNTADNWN